VRICGAGVLVSMWEDVERARVVGFWPVQCRIGAWAKSGAWWGSWARQDLHGEGVPFHRHQQSRSNKRTVRCVAGRCPVAEWRWQRQYRHDALFPLRNPRELSRALMDITSSIPLLHLEKKLGLSAVRVCFLHDELLERSFTILHFPSTNLPLIRPFVIVGNACSTQRLNSLPDNPLNRNLKALPSVVPDGNASFHASSRKSFSRPASCW
jgi:hypothetical protein